MRVIPYILLALLAWPAVLWAEEACEGDPLPAVDAPMAYVLRRGDLEATLTRQKMSEGLDIFDVKEGQVRNLDPASIDIGRLGDLDGWKAVVNFGLGDRTQLRWVGRRQDINFGRDQVERISQEAAVRFALLREREDRPAVSVEPIFRSNRGTGLQGAFRQYTDQGVPFTSADPIVVKPGDAHDETWAIRAIGSKRAGEQALLSFWSEFGHTRVRSDFETNLPIPQVLALLDGVDYDQTHFSYGLGLHYMFTRDFVAHIAYEHHNLDRDIDERIPAVVDTNDIYRARLSYRTAPSAWLSLELDIFGNQLTGEAPFLFNPRTAARFDRAYGYLGLGLTVQTNYGE